MRRRTADPTPQEARPWAVTTLRALNPDGSPLWATPNKLAEYQDYFQSEGSAAFGAIFMQDPSALAGDVFSPDWFRYWCSADFISKEGMDAKTLIELGMVHKILPAPTALHRAVGMDSAISKEDTADYTAIIAGWMSVDGDLFIDHVKRARLSPIEALKELVRISAAPRARALGVNEDMIEKALKSILPLVAGAGRLPWRPIPNEGKDKVVLARPLAGRYENGQVYHRYGAPWLQGYEGELASFPGGPFDDVVDGSVALYEAVERFTPRTARKARDVNEELRTPGVFPEAPGYRQRFS